MKPWRAIFGIGVLAGLVGVAYAQVDTRPPQPVTEDELRAFEQADPSGSDAPAGSVIEGVDQILGLDLELVDEPEPVRYDEYQTATLRALDKITGRSADIDVATGNPIVFGSLNVELKACYQTPPELPPESAAFLTVDSTQAVQVQNMEDGVDAATVDTVSADNPRLFSGWMFASSPGLSALEHPVYDIWVIHCNAPAPVVGASEQ